MLKTALNTVLDGRDLTRKQADHALNAIMTGECTDVQIAALLAGLRTKGETGDELAITVANRLTTKEGIEQTALARVKGKRLTILAISGLDHVERKSAGVERLEAAMRECLDYDAPVAAQAEAWDGDAPEAGSLHDAWHTAVGGQPVLSVPLKDAGGATLAILSVRRSPACPWTAEEIEKLTAMVAPFAGALPVLEAAGRSLAAHAAASLWTAPRALLSRRGLVRGALLALCCAGLAWGWLGSMTWRITATSSVRPLAARWVGAPLEARLVEAPHGPGDLVEEGALLARFDASGLELEAGQLEAELAILVLEQGAAIAGGDAVATRLAEAAVAEKQARLDLVRHRISLASVLAPHAGRLVEGDLRERVGDSFQEGASLFRLADTSGHGLVLHVPEADIEDLAVGQTGSFAPFARPELEFPFEVTRIAPSATSVDGANGFAVEARVDLDQDWVRSGMEGIGRVEVGPRRPLWIALHGVVDNLRLRSWL